ncbi:MAG: hypothetical protein HXL01_02765 [Candidatus Nanosynbacter sp.]|nr:hypothetical protein [Candidatus Nanosynbacter sp.]
MHIFVISPTVILLEKGKGFSGLVCGKKTTGNKPHSRTRWQIRFTMDTFAT